jgi:N-methylhydantoinase B
MAQNNQFKEDLKKTDPIVTEIIRNGLVAITEEMKTNLMRSAYSMIIYEAQDFTVGLFDANGETVSIGIGLPMFIRGMSDTVKAMKMQFSNESIDDGDIMVTNDAYITGSHLNHMTFVAPIISDGEIVGFSACMAHWADIGGALDGMTKDIYSEGLQMPIVKIYRKGIVSQDIMDIIKINIRIPERGMGDLNAQIAAVQTGCKRFLELVTRYNKNVVLQSISNIMDNTEAIAREQVLKIPDGIYEAESFMDDDGIDQGIRIPIKVKVIVKDDEMTIDLSDVSPQVKGFYNSGEAAGKACCQVAFKCLTSALEKPINEGSFRPLKIILPPGRVVSAVRPSPMRWWMTFPMTVVDTIFKALSPAIPYKVISGHHADLLSAAINGLLPDSGKLFILAGGLVGGGWGAKFDADGSNATICINDGDTHNSPVEQVEAKYPLMIERYCLRENSGGPGTYRGGLGTEKIVRATSPFMFNAQVERVNCRPWGLFDGLSGAGNRVSIQCGSEPELVFKNGKVLARQLQAGDAYILRSGGGGGYGSPLKRDIQKIRHDVNEGYVSKENAEKFYGVVFKKNDIDIESTILNRSTMKLATQELEELYTEPNSDPSDMLFSAASGFFLNRCC